MRIYNHRVIIIVPVSEQANANSLAAGFDPAGGGASTFGLCRLSRVAGGPVTHYACNTLMEDNVHQAIPPHSGILGTDGLAADTVTGEALLPGAAAWAAGAHAGQSGADVIAAGGWFRAGSLPAGIE